MARSRHRVPPTGNGLSPQVIAMTVVIVIVAAVATVFFLGQGGKRPEEPQEEEVMNPFEGLPPEREPERGEGR